MNSNLSSYQTLAIKLRHNRGQRGKSQRNHSISWQEETSLNGKPGNAIVIILPTKGCKWAVGEYGGCFMCGYIEDAPITPISQGELWDEFNKAINKFKDLKGPLALRIFNSGSFLDEEEVSTEIRDKIFRIVEEDTRIIEITIESRPEYISKEKLLELKELTPSKRIEIAIGLESSNDYIREELINKGFGFKDFENACDIILNVGLIPKAYLLLKPPFLSEEEAIQDVLMSVEQCTELGIQKISINPCTVQKGTIVEKLWNENKYRPPWLWSIIQILTSLHATSNQKPVIICEPTAGGKIRGAHNCRKCDKDILKAITQISLTQTLEGVEIPECECKNMWKIIKREELAIQRNTINILPLKPAELHGTNI